MKQKLLVGLLLLVMLAFALPYCKHNIPTPQHTTQNGKSSQDDHKPAVSVPSFNSENAYNHVKKQLAYGPRVPNTKAHDSCAAWIATQLTAYKAKVITQQFKTKKYTGELLNAKNIVGAYNPEAQRRIALFAHWDSRHMGEYDSDPKQHKKPIMGADDGASGVAVLLEIARVLSENPIANLGVDLIFLDAEDQGQPNDGGGFPEQQHTWCLGSQYWARTPHVGGYRANYGILLDMVGGNGARFTQEGTSVAFAPDILNKVWRTASEVGYGSYFDYARTPEIIDDHLYINQLARIPTIDIISRPANSSTGFPTHWHTQDDDINAISKNSLQAVGTVLLHVLYRESVGAI
jgi:hypothetical protein